MTTLCLCFSQSFPLNWFFMIKKLVWLSVALKFYDSNRTWLACTETCCKIIFNFTHLFDLPNQKMYTQLNANTHLDLCKLFFLFFLFCKIHDCKPHKMPHKSLVLVTLSPHKKVLLGCIIWSFQTHKKVVPNENAHCMRGWVRSPVGGAPVN